MEKLVFDSEGDPRKYDIAKKMCDSSTNPDRDFIEGQDADMTPFGETDSEETQDAVPLLTLLLDFTPAHR
jgi:hypothetical protein